MTDIMWVFGVNLVIWTGLVIWLWRLQRSLDRLEKKS
jgi:CcmD family protein